MSNIKLRIVTPNGELYNDYANMVIIRGTNGDMGIMKGHQPLTTTLAYGLLKIKKDEKELIATIFGGFADIQSECITILTDSGEWLEDIDENRAKKAKERAEERLRKNDDSIDVSRAKLALERSVLRLNSK